MNTKGERPASFGGRDSPAGASGAMAGGPGGAMVAQRASADDFAPLTERRAPLPGKSPAELARSLTPRTLRRWRNCVACGCPHVERSRICATCADWSHLLARLSLIWGRT